MSMSVETFCELGLDKPAPVAVNGRTFITDFAPAMNAPGDAVYHPCAEAYPGRDAPVGSLARYADWDETALYAGTLRDLAIYRPAGLNVDAPASLIIFNDGAMYLDPEGPVRAARVLDTLHAKAEIVPTIAIFVNPGRPRDARVGSSEAIVQRSREYDVLTDRYGRFLIDELLPFVVRTQGVRITNDPTRRIVCGMSSGGICAFTAAWRFPNAFGRVLSHCGSFTNIRGGDAYPYLVRSTPRKPLRVYLQGGENDGRSIYGDWPLANQQMAAALAFAGYDHHFEYGVGGHTLRHAGAVMADALRWLCRAD
jgi:enterochelin esterase family protein